MELRQSASQWTWLMLLYNQGAIQQKCNPHNSLQSRSKLRPRPRSQVHHICQSLQQPSFNQLVLRDIHSGCRRHSHGEGPGQHSRFLQMGSCLLHARRVVIMVCMTFTIQSWAMIFFESLKSSMADLTWLQGAIVWEVIEIMIQDDINICPRGGILAVCPMN